MTRPPPLPLPVPFPVYGLDVAFTGARNLVGWNDQQRLWTVTLRFAAGRSVDDGAEHVTIETIRKQPDRTSPEDDSPAEPMGLGEAALHAVISATSDEVRGRQAKAAQRALHVAEVKRIDFGDGGVVLHDWAATSVIVDDVPVDSHERTIGTFRVVVVDLPDVALNVVAASNVDLAPMRLVDVRDDLGEYRWPSIREHMRPRLDPPPPPSNRRLRDIHFGLLDIYANATDDETDPRELLARVEHVVDHMLHDAVPRADDT